MACTVASNLRDSPPFGSSPSPDLAGRLAAEWKQHFEEGIRHETAGDHAAAVEFYEQAVDIDAHRADLQFRLARSLLACRRVEEARRHYILARDLDTLRFRADTRINATIRAAAAGHDQDGVHLVDVERACALASPDELPGHELFDEHVHLTLFGNYVIARHLFEKIVGLLPAAMHPSHENGPAPLSMAECAQQLAYTDWGRSAALQVLARQFTQTPFSDQLDSAERNERVRQELARLKERIDSGGMDEAIATYRKALARANDDFMLRMDFAYLLISHGDFDEATENIRILQDTLPHHPAPHVLLANLLIKQRRRDEALAQCTIALRLQPGSKQVLDLQKQLTSAGKRRGR
jgi:tetratricopeptide (TPR) repeat protein